MNNNFLEFDKTKYLKNKYNFDVIPAYDLYIYEIQEGMAKSLIGMLLSEARMSNIILDGVMGLSVAPTYDQVREWLWTNLNILITTEYNDTKAIVKPFKAKTSDEVTIMVNLLPDDLEGFVNESPTTALKECINWLIINQKI